MSKIDETEWGAYTSAPSEPAPSLTPSLARMGSLLAELKNTLVTPPSATTRKLFDVEKLQKRCEDLEKTVASLRTALKTSGNNVEVDDSLESLETKLHEAAKLLLEGDASQEAVIERLDDAIKGHPAFLERQRLEDEAFENSEREANRKAYEEQLRYVPENISSTTFDALVDHSSKPIAKRLFANKILWLLRLDPERLKRIHPVDLRDRYVLNSGLDLIELRAIFFAVTKVDFVANDHTGAKKTWLTNLRTKLKSLLASNTPSQARHSVYRSSSNEDTSSTTMKKPPLSSTKKPFLRNKATPSRRPLFPPNTGGGGNADLLAALQKRRSKNT